MKNLKKLLTDRTLRTVKAPTERTLIWDTAVPGAYLLITPNGNISYDFMKRIRGQMKPVRRIVGYAWRVGQQPPIPLAELCDMARAMLSDMAKGIDPKAKARAEKEAKDAQARSTFENVAKDFLADHVAEQKSAKIIAQTFATLITLRSLASCQSPRSPIRTLSASSSQSPRFTNIAGVMFSRTFTRCSHGPSANALTA